jgi:hypothetical protein
MCWKVSINNASKSRSGKAAFESCRNGPKTTLCKIGRLMRNLNEIGRQSTVHPKKPIA